MNAKAGSFIVPSYASGDYYATHEDPDQDAAFKADAFLKLFGTLVSQKPLQISSYADVGCGGGRTAALITEGLKRDGHPIESAAGYDIFPSVHDLKHSGVRFLCQDFCQSEERADLVTLFDVAEHVPDTISFLKNVASRSLLVGLHIPLDNSLANAVLNRYRRKLSYPKHVLFLDVPNALNLLTLSGIMPLDYRFTFGFMAPSGTMSMLQRFSFPFRWAVSAVNPWLASRTIGGVSLMVVGATEAGLRRFGAW
ncbi:MAG TPA: methyltransferase domain-containing protein [Bryobacteraceae bacterium]|nr:methyltransferase domain-containing protein [Bryobacteraceae bacterium]